MVPSISFEVTNSSQNQIKTLNYGDKDSNDACDNSETSLESYSESIEEPEVRTKLTSQEVWNLTFCFLAWACSVSTFTLVIGTSNNVLLSIGADTRITSIPLGAFFLGSAMISCGITEPLFRRAGRQNGFFAGLAISLFATALGVLCLILKSPALNIISTFFFGAANGVNYFLRFAVVENVPHSWAAKSVTIVVSGGIIAAFVGPEASQFTTGLFGDNENLYYMGVYLMSGIFTTLNILCIAAIKFAKYSEKVDTTVPDEISKSNCIHDSYRVYKDLLCTRSFLVPLMVATLSWIVMVVPMSVLRVAMRDAGFTSRQSLYAIELHFCGMYGPGLFTGSLIKYFGTRKIVFAGWCVSCLAITLLLFVKTEVEGTIATWLIGMFALGVGWNFQFTGTTVRLNDSMKDMSCTRGQVQSSNDFLMFFIAGSWIVSASFVYNASFFGSGILSGWMTLIYCVISFLIINLVVMGVDYHFERRKNCALDKGHVEGDIEQNINSTDNVLRVIL